MPELSATYDSTKDVLTLRSVRLDQLGKPIVDDYRGQPANVPESTWTTIIWKYFSLDNQPSSAVVPNYRAVWANQPAYFTNMTATFFGVEASQIQRLLPPS